MSKIIGPGLTMVIASGAFLTAALFFSSLDLFSVKQFGVLFLTVALVLVITIIASK